MVDEAHREIYRKRLDAMPAEMREYLQWRKEQRMAFAAKDARIAELEEALQPFAREADGVAEFRADYFVDIKDGDEVLGVVAVADFRRARAVLEKGTRT